MRRILAAILLLPSSLSSQGPPPNWKLIEELRIGSLDGPEAFARITGITLAADGGWLYVADQPEHAIKVFNASTGSFVRRIGRYGEGPGEFRQLQNIGWNADTLYATDHLLQRISLFSANGEHQHTQVIAPRLEAATSRGSAPIGVVAGNVVMLPRLLSLSVARGQAVSRPWALVRRDGGIIGMLAREDVRGAIVSLPLGDGSATMIQPMTKRSFLALHPRGTSMIVVTQPAIEDPEGEFELVALRPEGSTIYSRRYHYTPRAVQQEVRDSIIASRARELERIVEPGRAVRIAKEHVRIPRTYPPFDRLVLGEDGSVWLRHQDLSRPSDRWLVLDERGEIQANVVVPAGLDILYVNATDAWGVVRDDLDVPYVVRSRIQR